MKRGEAGRNFCIHNDSGSEDETDIRSILKSPVILSISRERECKNGARRSRAEFLHS